VVANRRRRLLHDPTQLTLPSKAVTSVVTWVHTAPFILACAVLFGHAERTTEEETTGLAVLVTVGVCDGLVLLVGALVGLFVDVVGLPDLTEGHPDGLLVVDEGDADDGEKVFP